MKQTALFLLLAAVALCAPDATGPSPTGLRESPFNIPVAGEAAPSDALVLFNGASLAAWADGAGVPAGWKLDAGLLAAQPGASPLATRQSFADCQLHVEWRAPDATIGASPEPGSIAVLLQGRYAVQIPASTDNPASATAPGKTAAPPSNPTPDPSRRESGWQSGDILYTAPRFNNDGSLKQPAFATVWHNGLLVRDHVAFPGSIVSPGQFRYEKHAFRQPLVLPSPRHQVAFRNIWIRELGVHSLLNGVDTVGWYSYLENLGKNNDPQHNFKVEHGLLHVEGRNFGYLATEQSYANYYLRVVFKWGRNQYAPRATGKRDSGILYHFATTEPDKVWPKSFECQVQEGDCGDYWCVGGATIDSPNPSAIEWNMKRIPRTADFELPTGEWNTIEIVCNGDQSEHYVNGHLVNAGTKASLTSGKILLQSEGAEIYYKTVELIAY